jgi:putative addiction module component (TIGR02574 family)
LFVRAWHLTGIRCEEPFDHLGNRPKHSGMKLADFPALKKLPARNRLSLAQELWDSAASDALAVPESHKKLIRSRRAAYARGEVRTLTMGELAKSIRRRK